jgi:hypothetical protein
MSKPMINKDTTVSGTNYTLEDLCKKIDSLNTKLNRTRTIAQLIVASGVTIAEGHQAIAIKDPLTGVVQLRALLYKDIVSGWNEMCSIPTEYRPKVDYLDYTNVSNANDLGGHIRISGGSVYFYGNSNFTGGNHPIYIDVVYLTEL